MSAKTGDVRGYPSDFVELQRTVWERLPMRKYLCGHKAVFDVVAVVVQEWPDGAILECKSGETMEVTSLQELARSCKRHMALAYGMAYDDQAHTLSPLIWQVILLVLHWFRQKPDNAAALSRWKSKWCYRKRSN